MSDLTDPVVWGDNHTTRIHLQPTADGLELTAEFAPYEETTITLDPDAVRKLRRALARYEREVGR